MSRGSISKYEGKKGTSWRIRFVTGYNEHGRPIVRSHTVKGTKREAEVKLRELLKEVDNGTFVEPSNITLEEFINKWFETHRQGISHSTELRYKVDIKNHIIPGLGSIKMQKLTTMQVQEFVTQLHKEGFRGNGSPRGLSSRSIQGCVGLLKLALEQAIEWGFLNRNPVKGVKIPRVKDKEPQFITEEQAAAILTALEGTYVWLPTLIAFHTGARRGEILALSWDCVDLDSATIKISRSFSLNDASGPIFKEPKTKAGRRIVEIGQTLVKALKVYRKDQVKAQLAAGERWNNQRNLVCTKKDGGIINPNALSELFSYNARQLGIDVTFHCLRHTHVSMLIKAGVAINVISARIGHSNTSTTLDVYSHLLPGMSRDAVDRFEDLLNKPLTNS